MSLLRDNMTILFQGDSVTDAGRSREDPDDLGPGYPRFAAETLKKSYSGLTVINGGSAATAPAIWSPAGTRIVSPSSPTC